MTIFRLDKIEVKKDKMEVMPSGALRFNVTLTRSGIFLYKDAKGNVIRELRHPKEVFSKESLDTIKGMIFTDEHPPEMINQDNWKTYAVGSFGDNVQVRDNQYIENSITVYDKDTVKKILSGEKVELSAGYWADTVKETGIYNGQQYDSIQKNIRYNHGSLVEKGRAGENVKIKFDNQDIDIFILEKLEDKSHMAQIKIDGVEFEVGDQVLPIIQKKLDSLVILEKEKEALKGKFDTLNAQMEKVRQDQEKEARNSFILSVKPFLDKQEITDSMTERQIKELVIKSENKEAKLDGFSDDYVSGIFDMILSVKKTKTYSVKPSGYDGLKQVLNEKIKDDNKPKVSRLDGAFQLLSKGGK